MVTSTMLMLGLVTGGNSDALVWNEELIFEH